MPTKRTTYASPHLTQVAAIIWDEIFGQGAPTSVLARQLGTERAARALSEQGWLAKPETLPSSPRLPPARRQDQRVG